MKLALIYTLIFLILGLCQQFNSKRIIIEGETRKIKILQCGDYKRGDVNPKDAKLKWTGLFFKGVYTQKDKYYIADTKIKFLREHSETDTDGENTGWRLKTINKDHSVILIAGANNLVSGPVNVALVSKTLNSIGQKLIFNYNSVAYTLYTTGNKKDGVIYNYKLFLKAKSKGIT